MIDLKLQLMLVLATATISVKAADYDAKIDGIYYNFSPETQEASVTYQYFWGCAYNGFAYKGDVVIPSTVQYNDETYWVTSIGDYAFVDCDSLTSVTLPVTVDSIGNLAFQFSGLTSVRLPATVHHLGVNPWALCPGITSITVEESNTSYDSRGGCNAIIDSRTNALVTGCDYTTIPTDITAIGDYAFYACKGLSPLILPESVTRIGAYAFSECYDLTSVTIKGSVENIEPFAFAWDDFSTFVLPEGTRSIDEAAFYSCDHMKSFTLPSTLERIESNAFDECDSLTDIYVYPTTPPYLESDVFKLSMWKKKVTVHVKKGYADVYRNDGRWLSFTIVDDLDATPNSLTAIVSDKQAKDGKFIHNGRIIIRKNDRTYSLSGTPTEN